MGAAVDATRSCEQQNLAAHFASKRHVNKTKRGADGLASSTTSGADKEDERAEQPKAEQPKAEKRARAESSDDSEEERKEKKSKKEKKDKSTAKESGAALVRSVLEASKFGTLGELLEKMGGKKDAVWGWLGRRGDDAGSFWLCRSR